MNKKELIKILTDSGIDKIEASAEIELVLEFVLNKTREELILENNFDDSKILSVIKKRIDTKMPIQYILGFAPFMGEKFIVNENVLIPRDETEILVRKTFSKIQNRTKILDIGTGTGIIALTLAKMSKQNNLETEILGTDISNEALGIALDNTKNLGLIGQVMFRKSDIFSNIRENEKFDIIVSNPPYIPKYMKETIQKEVLFEPDLALYTNDNDGLYFYKKIIKNAPEFLNKGGHILFEIMENQSKDIEKLLKENNFKNIEITKDLANIERVISADY